MKKQLLILTTLLITSMVYSQTVGDTFVEDFITYQVTSITPNEVRIEDYDVNGGTTVNIPATVTNIGTTYNVTEIYQTSFFNKGLTSVTIPNTITSIGTAAFITNNLTTITIPNSVISIGISCFQNNQITELTIPNSVTSIGESAFKNNPLVTISSGATTPPAITSGGGGDTFNSNRSGIDLIIPIGTTTAYTAATWTGFNSVTEVSPLAIGDTFIVDFITYEVTSLTPETVKAIDYNMAGGTVVDIPAYVPSNISIYTVTSIGDAAFKDKGLTGVTLPNSLLSLGFEAFRNNSITSINLPNSLTNIGDYVFISNQLTSIVIPDSVTEIGGYAFYNNSLTIATLPVGITNIAIGTFENNSLSSITIPNGVTNIDNAAFKNNALTSVTIPSSVTSISIQVFRGNPLNSVTSLSTTPPTITTGGNTDSFSSNRSNINLTIPNGTENAYIAAQWINFASVTLNTSDFELANAIKVITTTDGISVVTSNNVRLENYTIYSLTGAKVATGTDSEISTSFLANGIYVLKLDFDKGSMVRKVMVN